MDLVRMTVRWGRVGSEGVLVVVLYVQVSGEGLWMRSGMVEVRYAVVVDGVSWGGGPNVLWGRRGEVVAVPWALIPVSGEVGSARGLLRVVHRIGRVDRPRGRSRAEAVGAKAEPNPSGTASRQKPALVKQGVLQCYSARRRCWRRSQRRRGRRCRRSEQYRQNERDKEDVER
jgi:hypothetical protein